MLTKPSKPIHPSWNLFPSQSKTHIVAEMVAILGKEIIRISRVFFCYFFHECTDLLETQIWSTNQYWFSECESRAMLRFHLKYPSCRMLMSTKCILNPMNYQNKVKEETQLRKSSWNQIALQAKQELKIHALPCFSKA